MKIAIIVIITLILGFHLANTKITFKPFSISFETPYYPFAVLFLFLSITFFQIQAEETGFKKGWNKAIDKVTEITKNL